MKITKVVKPFIKMGWPNTFGNIVYIAEIQNIAMWVFSNIVQRYS